MHDPCVALLQASSLDARRPAMDTIVVSPGWVPPDFGVGEPYERLADCSEAVFEVVEGPAGTV